MIGIRMGKSVMAAGLLYALTTALSPVAHAQSVANDLAPRLLFAVSGGFWKGETKLNTLADDAKGSGDAAAQEERRGYYRISAYRGEDNTSKVYLQRIELADKGPKIAETMELEKLNGLNAYVTDIRQDNASGVSATEGFSAFIALKLDPKAADTATWTVLVDEYGTVSVEKPTN